MSHPWKAQPYYLYHDPRTTGTVPAPMGLGGVYTRGSFTPKSPWATPGYVTDEPTGVDGFGGYGFGQAENGACVPFATVKNAIAKGLSEGAGAIGAGQDFITKELIKSELPKLAGTITKKLQALSRTTSGAQAGLTDLLTQAVGGVVEDIPVIGSVLKSVMSIIVAYGSKYIADFAQICPPESLFGKPMRVEIRCENCAGIKRQMDLFPASRASLEILWKENGCDTPQCVGATAVTFRPDIQALLQFGPTPGTVMTTSLLQRAAAAGRLTLVKPRVTSPTAPAPVAPKKGISTTVIIGAAALAALVLLK